MRWVAWRQHRSELFIMLGILTAMAVLLVPTGLDKWATFRDSGLESCLQGGGDCLHLADQLNREYDRLGNILPWFNFLPAVIGMLLAAPLIAEFEQRTYRLAWTQSVARDRWLAIKLGVIVAGAVAFAVLLTVLMTWWYTPLDRTMPLAGKHLGESYDFEGLMPFVYTLFATGLALAVGVVSRKALVALPVALVGFFVARMAVQKTLRDGFSSSVAIEVGSKPPPLGRDMEHFWTVQAEEAAIFLSLALVLFVVTFLLARRRTG
jgi:hypothetical protein